MKTHNKNRPTLSGKTKKTRPYNTNLCGKIIRSLHGWKQMEIWGSPFERGYAHGHLLHVELSKIKESLPFQVSINLQGVSYKQYSSDCKRLILPKVKRDFHEIYKELEGIVQGAKSMDTVITIEDLIEWNALVGMNEFYNKNTSNKNPRCSAFIATGNATAKGDIIMAHNTHSDFVSGQFLNIIMLIRPAKGNVFRMQTAAGLVSSTTDWFLCENGIIGCESTIADVNYKADFVKGTPYFCRIRKAMQYGNTLDDYVSILLDKNAGDYPCSWLLGDTRSGEIMRFELGKNHHSVAKTKNGLFYGVNQAIDQELVDNEIKRVDYTDMTTSIGSRNHRFSYLLYDKYYGKLDTNLAKDIISDHYDSHSHTVSRNQLAICRHCELDSYKPTNKNKPRENRLYGSVDGKVVNTEMSKNLGFFGRFGSACGRHFSINQHIHEHPYYKKYAPYVQDFASEPWTNL